MSEKALVKMKDGREYVLTAEPYTTFWNDWLWKIPGPVGTPRLGLGDVETIWLSSDLTSFLRGTKNLPYKESEPAWKFTADLPMSKAAQMFQKAGGPLTPITPAREDVKPVEEPVKPTADDYGA